MGLPDFNYFPSPESGTSDSLPSSILISLILVELSKHHNLVERDLQDVGLMSTQYV